MKTFKKKIFQQKKTLSAFSIVIPALLLSAFCLESCRKFIEIPPPTSQLVAATVFNNDATATSAVVGIYNKMFGSSESTNMAISNGLLADELKLYTTSPSYSEPYINQLTAGLSPPGNWNNAYSYIYQANAILSSLKQSTGTSPAVKQQLMGEAYFIRAFWYFYLTDQYGAVPLALATDYTVTDKLARTPRKQIFQQIITDLRMSQGLLNTQYVDATDTAATTDRVRPNRAVATALLARAYLYLGDYNSNNPADYALAEKEADTVINNSAYALCTNLSGANSVFLVNSSEAIWQLYTPLPAKNNTTDGNQFILTARPTAYSISPQLLAAFEPNDQRLVNWIGSVTAAGTTYYFPYKYKVKTGGAPISEYTMVLRLAEQYLIRAEARAEQGNISGAQADLNVIRTRAGLPNTTASDQPSLLAAILHERQVELFTEWGARWFDLNRAVNTASTVNVNTVMSVVTPTKNGTWSTDGHQELYPIPQSQLILDVYLTQNPGY